VRTDTFQANPLPKEPSATPWILVPLGNPGEEYVATRHNMGRLMVQRWMDAQGLKPRPMRRFSTGILYSLMDPFMALIPGTYMNLSGQVCAEAVAAGFDPAKLLMIHDDKDLPLGTGRLKQNGSDAGHNGVRSVFECLGSNSIYRLRMGIGPFTRPLHEFVLSEWTDPEWEILDATDTPFAAAMDLIASGRPLDQVMNLVNANDFWNVGCKATEDDS
jgi:PTH1 family peptidyl-tRNA hydrolase